MAAHLKGEARVEMRDKIVAMYKEEVSIRDIATRIGRSYGWVHRMLIETGIELRGIGGQRGKRVARKKSYVTSRTELFAADVSEVITQKLEETLHEIFDTKLLAMVLCKMAVDMYSKDSPETIFNEMRESVREAHRVRARFLANEMGWPINDGN